MSMVRCLLLLSSFAALATASWSTAEVADEAMQEGKAAGSHPQHQGFWMPPAMVSQSVKSSPTMEPMTASSGEKIPSRFMDLSDAELTSSPEKHHVHHLLTALELATGEALHKQEETWVTVVLVIVVISLSILFESVQSTLLQSLEGHPYMLIVVNGMFKELTLLGFVALVSTTLVKTGAFRSVQKALEEWVSEGKSEAQDAPGIDIKEMFEEVHLLIFIIINVFVSLVLFLLTTAWQTKKFFESAEIKKTRDLKTEVENLSLFSPYGLFQRWTLVQKMQYRILRKEFFQPTSGSLPTLVRPATFKFSAYLGMCMAFSIVDMIEVPVSTWISLMLIVVVSEPVMTMEDEKLFLSMMLISWVLFAMILIIFIQTRRIFAMCLPAFTPSFLVPNPVGTKQERKKTTPTFYALAAKRAKCPKIARLIYGTESPTKHEQCFILWKNGPAMHRFFLRLHVFLEAVFIGVYVKMVVQKPWLLLQHKLYTLMQWVPFFVGQVILWPNLIFFSTIITSTGMLRQDKAMNLTIQQQLAEKYSRYFLLIYELNTLAHINYIKLIVQQGREDIRSYALKYVRRFEQELPVDAQKEIEELYRLWDADLNDRLDMLEFTNLLNSTGLNQAFAEHLAGHWFHSGILSMLPRDIGSSMEQSLSISRKTGSEPASRLNSRQSENTEETTCQTESKSLLDGFNRYHTPGVHHHYTVDFRGMPWMSSQEPHECNGWNDEDAVPLDTREIPWALRRSIRSIEYLGGSMSITLNQFKMLYMIMREIEINGTAEENLFSWFVSVLTHRESRDDYTIHVNDFEEVEDLRDVARYCGMDTPQQVRQLFCVIANPPDEDDVIEEVHVRDFTAWICRMMVEQKSCGQTHILVQ